MKFQPEVGRAAFGSYGNHEKWFFKNDTPVKHKIFKGIKP
jgi:hypothetical protein